jgi:hypothetical protein
MGIMKIRHAVIGWATMEIGKRVIKRKMAQLQPWRRPKRGGKGRLGAAVAGFTVVAGGAWLVRRLTGGGDDSSE